MDDPLKAMQDTINQAQVTAQESQPGQAGQQSLKEKVIEVMKTVFDPEIPRSEEHTSELQSHSDLHSFPTRRSSDLGTLRAGVLRNYGLSKEMPRRWMIP